MALATEVVNEYEVGDVVVLKSGGRLMTVTDNTRVNISTLYWLEDHYEDGVFAREILKKV